MSLISAAVGDDCPNLRADVRTVQGLLNKFISLHGSQPALVVDGWYGAKTARAIGHLQTSVLGLPMVYRAMLEPGSIGLIYLNALAPTTPVPTAPGGIDLFRNEDISSYSGAARALGCEAAAVEAVAKVETFRSPFDSQGRPTILFERHVFSRRTGRRHDASHPDISNREAGGYGPTNTQYDRLARAKALDETEALKSASWGKFQIMGFNHIPAGYVTVQVMVSMMGRSEAEHFGAFVRFVKADPRLLTAIRAKDFTTFASIYNGPDYAINNYDVRMKRFYDEAIRREEAASRATAHPWSQQPAY